MLPWPWVRWWGFCLHAVDAGVALAQHLDKLGASLALLHFHAGVAEFADVGRAQQNLGFLVDDHFVVVFRAQAGGKDRPAVFGRIQSGQEVVGEASADLRFIGVGVELRMAVEQTMGGVAAIFVHGGEH